MKLVDALEQVTLSFGSNKFKTLMSCLGIIIGVIAIVVMLSVGEGLQEGVGKAFGGMNLDVITVFPGGSQFEGPRSVQQKPAEFDDRDVHALENTVGVRTVSPRTQNSVSIKFRDEERMVSIGGVSPENEPELAGSIDKGRFLMDSDKSAIVIGSDIANKMFRMQLNPGMRISIRTPNNNDSKEFTIAGILKEQVQMSAFGGNPNNEIFTTHEAMKDLIDVKKYSYSMILVTVENPDNLEITSKKVDESLQRLHKDEGFTVFTMKSILESIGQVLVMIKYGLGGIGAISLVVGGIGIVNVMMLTVTERIKEIGVMKAVGATRENILMLFLLEAGLLGFVSGLIGVAIGASISFLISTLGSFPMAISWSSMVIGLAFGIITTVVAGVYPANRAARLDPVEALRAE